MKPRNKKQEQILAMSGQLRPLTTAQKQWALTHSIDNYALKFKKGKAVCLICGHVWEAEEGMCRCPHCGAKVEVKATTQRVVRERSYFNIITAVKGFQVIRMFLMIVEFRKGMKANPGFVEIGSYWIDKHGHTTVVGLQRTLGHYIDSFAFGSLLEIRHDNDAFWHIDSPMLIMPEDLTAAHDLYVGKVNRKREEERREADRKRAIEDQAKFIELKSRYFGLSMSDGQINLHTLDTIHDYYEVGTRMNICTGSAHYFNKSESLVLVAYIGTKQVAAIEIALSDCSIIQCRGYANGRCEYSKQIADIIKANTSLIEERKRA